MGKPALELDQRTSLPGGSVQVTGTGHHKEMNMDVGVSVKVEDGTRCNRRRMLAPGRDRDKDRMPWLLGRTGLMRVEPSQTERNERLPPSRWIGVQAGR